MTRIVSLSFEGNEISRAKGKERPANSPQRNVRPSKVSPFVINVFLVVLGLFQCLLLIWLRTILRAVWKAIAGKEGVEDSRSDSEAEDAKED